MFCFLKVTQRPRFSVVLELSLFVSLVSYLDLSYNLGFISVYSYHRHGFSISLILAKSLFSPTLSQL